MQKIKFNGTIAQIGTYIPEKLINKGNRTTVYLAWCTLRNCQVIVKIANKEMSERNCEKWIEREAKFLFAAKHPYLVNIYEHITEPVHAIVEEYYPIGTLHSFIQARHRRLQWYDVINIYSKLLSAVSYIHSLGYVHLDIKLKNILYENGIFKLIDYGFIRVPGLYGQIGTKYTMSPEQARKEAVDFSADIWSLGVILFYLATGQYPYNHSNKDDPLPQKTLEPKDIADYVDAPEWFYKTVSSMLSVDASHRPTIENLINTFVREEFQGIDIRC